MLSIKDLLISDHSVSITRNTELMNRISTDQEFFDEVFQQMWDDNKKVRRAASVVVRRALEINPKLISGHKRKIMNALENYVSDEVKWCVALTFKHLKLTAIEKHKVFVKLLKWMKDPIGSGSQAACMTGLADVSAHDRKLKPILVDELNAAFRSEQPALKARAKNLLKEIK